MKKYLNNEKNIVCNKIIKNLIDFDLLIDNIKNEIYLNKIRIDSKANGILNLKPKQQQEKEKKENVAAKTVRNHQIPDPWKFDYIYDYKNKDQKFIQLKIMVKNSL